MDPSQLDLQHGIKGILFSVVGLVAISLASSISKAVWAYVRRNKWPTREEFKELTQALHANSELLSHQKHITDKMAMDFRRIYLFLKEIAGDKWPQYRKQVEEIEKEIKSY